jgi:hypothetical protein
MSQAWPWFKFIYGILWWPVCRQGWYVVFGLWALAGCACLLKPYIPTDSPYALAEVAVLLGYTFFAFSKTEFPRMRWPKP